jgi:hypothetical protein
MKLSMLGIVNRTADALRRVEEDIAGVELGMVFVTVGGRQQDDAMTAAAKGAILAELRGRKASLERDLDSYGVKVERA